MTDQKDPNWVPPWEIVEGEGFVSSNASDENEQDASITDGLSSDELVANAISGGQFVDIPKIWEGRLNDENVLRPITTAAMVADLMSSTNMSAKELIAASSVNDKVPFSEFEQRVVDNNIALIDKMLELKEKDIASRLKFGEVSWNPEIKGLEKISGRGVLPASYPYNSVVKAISAMGKEDTIPTLTLPLSDDMKLLLSNQSNAIFLVDYSTDIHRGGEFLEQFKDLPCAADVVFSEHLSHEEYEELLRAFMTSESIYQIPILITAVADVILVYRGNRFDQSPYSSPFTEDYVQYFLARNVSLLDRWLTFCDSMLLFGIYAIKVLNNHYRPEEHFPVINDAFYIGSNVTQLMRMPEFSAHYFAIENVDRSFYYFKQQFETDCFDGEGMLKYFRSKNNYLCAGLEGIAQGHFKPSDVGFGIFNKGVFAPDYPIGEFNS